MPKARDLPKQRTQCDEHQPDHDVLERIGIQRDADESRFTDLEGWGGWWADQSKRRRRTREGLSELCRLRAKSVSKGVHVYLLDVDCRPQGGADMSSRFPMSPLCIEEQMTGEAHWLPRVELDESIRRSFFRSCFKALDPLLSVRVQGSWTSQARMLTKTAGPLQ